MQLPEHLQIFSEPSLILIGNFGKTNFYIAHEINIDLITTLEAPEISRPDSESSVVINSGRRALSDSANNEEEDRKQYSKQLARAIIDLSNNHNAQNIQLIMPQELIRRVKNEIPVDVINLIIRELDKDLVKTELKETLERLSEIPVRIQ
jgi:protein required for attachment to host cells